MKIIHICTPSNYNVTIPFVRFINSEFNISEHDFYIMGHNNNVPIELRSHVNVTICEHQNIIHLMKMISEMRRADKVLLHSLNKTYFQLILLLNRKIHEKLYWISWGADLYQWKSQKKGLKYFIRNKIAYHIRMKITNFVGIFPPDIEVFKKEFKTQAKTFYASYVESLYNPIYKEELNLINLTEKRDKKKCINIQIGHSSAPILNHEKVLRDLVKYKDEDIKIFLPLSYGNQEYGNKIEKKAKQLFGEKAVCIREMMDINVYMDHLSRIDIAIFNTDRQIGLGNITPMLYMQKKIYIPKRTVMFEYFNSLSINICDYSRIKNMDYYEFTKPISMDEGRRYVLENTLNKDKNIEMWEKVFGYPTNEEHKNGN